MEERPRSPLLLIVSSPSGAGKTTLTNALRARVAGVNFSVRVCESSQPACIQMVCPTLVAS